MKFFYTSMLVLAMLFSNESFSQQTTERNLLGAKGTFSAPFVTPNNSSGGSYGSDPCTRNGQNTFSPFDNIGKRLSTLSGAGTAQPASGYAYTGRSGGLQPEGQYTLIKNIGDANGGNCIKGDWIGQDHTGDGGWFMAVNGAPNSTVSKTFYSILNISVCPGTKYEFSAWVINLLPAYSEYAEPNSEPNISFVVKWGNQSTTIATSGPIAYQNLPTWIKVSGTFTVPNNVSMVDLEVNNATQVALGNDLGLDDISLNVVESNISISSSAAICENTSATIQFTVNDPTETNTWYKWQISTDGGATYTDNSAPAQATFNNGSYTLPLNLYNVLPSQNNYKYLLVASTSEAGLSNAECTFVNEFTLIVTSCGPMPVNLVKFDGKFINGQVVLDWLTTQETNSDRFEILKSTDGQNFSLVGSVKAGGMVNTPSTYTYIDRNPGVGKIAYYRLQQVDLDGKGSVSGIVKVILGESNSAEVFPNPFSSYFRISFNANKTADATIIVRNTLGQSVMQRVVKTIKGVNVVNVDNISSLKPGVYYINISNDDINYNFRLQKQ